MILCSTCGHWAGDCLMVDQKVLGILFGVGAGVMWAVEAILGKLLFPILTFVQVTASEVFFATLTTFPYILIRRERIKFEWKNIWNLLIVGLVGTVFAPLMYFFGLTQTFAINATLIAHLQPLFIAILGFYFLKERLHKPDFIGGLLVISAAILITSRTVDNLASFKIGSFGDLMALLATLAWALVAIPGKQLAKITSSVTIVGYRFLIASVVFIPILLYSNQLVVNSTYQVLLGMLVGLGYIFYYEGLKRIKASQVALTELSSPFFAAVFAWYLLGEIMTSMQTAGFLLLTCGLFILAKK